MTGRVLVPLNPPDWGGLHEIAVRVAPRSANAGWPWTVVVPEEARAVAGRLSEANVDVQCVPMRRLRKSVRPEYWTAYARNYGEDVARIVRLSRAENVQVVQNSGAHHFHGVSVAKQMNLPLVWQMHSTAAPRLLRTLVNIRAARSADVLMTSGSAYLDAHRSLAAFRTPVLSFLPPIDTNVFRRDSQTRIRVRREFAIADDEFCIGTVGSQSRVKNHPVLIAAVAGLRATGVPARLLLIGSPSPAHSDWYRTDVVDAAARLGETRDRALIAQVVEGGSRVQMLLNALDVFALPSLGEGAPLALAEAMSMGLPVIASSVGSVPSMVTQGLDGLLMENQDASSLIANLTRLYRHPSERAEIGAAGRITAMDKFSVEACANLHIEGYETAASRHALR